MTVFREETHTRMHSCISVSPYSFKKSRHTERKEACSVQMKKKRERNEWEMGSVLGWKM